MRKLKKFKRYDEGGAVGAGSGDPFSYTDFSNRARSVKAEERKEAKAEKTEDAPTRAEPVKPAETKPVESGSGKIASSSTMTDEESRADYDKGAAPSSFTTTASRPAAGSSASASKPAAPKPAKITQDSEAGKSRGMRGDGPPVFSTPPRRAKPEDIPGTDVIPGPKGEEIDNSNLAGKQLAQSAMAASPALRGVGAGIRGAMGLGRMFESASTPAPKSTPKIEPRLDSKADTVSAKPAVERVKDAKIEGPSAPPKPKTATEEMGLRDTPSMERMRKAKEAAKEGPPEPLRVKTSAERKGLKETPSMERMRKAKEAAKEGPPAPAKTKTPAEEMGLSETSAMEKSRKANEGPPDLGARSRRVAAAQKRSDKIPQKEREPGFMQEYIAGRAEKRNRIKDLPNDGLSTPRYDMKKGGKIPAFKKGGFVGRADGCAQRGKTKGRMV